MKVLCCFKIVPEFDMVLEDDWKIEDEGTIDLSYVKPVWNCFDESALEIVLKLSDQSESFKSNVEINALTIGKKKHENFLKILYAIGYKKAIRINQEDDCIFEPEIIAELIAQYNNKIQMHDVIVLGQQSSDGNNMKTPYILAEIMGWTCVSQVTHIEIWEEKYLRVISQYDDKKYVQIIKPPCILIVGNTEKSYLRVPTLKEKIKFKNKEINTIQIDEILENKVDNNIEIVQFQNMNKSRKSIVLDGNSPEEKANKIFELYLKERMGKD